MPQYNTELPMSISLFFYIIKRVVNLFLPLDITADIAKVKGIRVRCICVFKFSNLVRTSVLIDLSVHPISYHIICSIIHHVVGVPVKI